jgi:hypothetical protein
MAEAASGGRTWWAHFEFTRINIEPIILRNKIEDAREVGALSPPEAHRNRKAGVRAIQRCRRACVDALQLKR